MNTLDNRRILLVDDMAEIHADFRSYAMRSRLDAVQGGHGNQAIWTGALPLEGYEGPNGSMASAGFLVMDQWLSNIQNDASNATLPQKVIADKPAAAVDTCFDGTGDVVPVQSTCSSIYPYYGDPRIGSGHRPPTTC